MKTNKTKALKTFVELFDIILTGNKDNSRIAARKVRKLIYSLWKPAYKKYKYVNFLPACPYKSIQMALSNVDYFCGELYMKQLKSSLFGDNSR